MRRVENQPRGGVKEAEAARSAAGPRLGALRGLFLRALSAGSPAAAAAWGGEERGRSRRQELSSAGPLPPFRHSRPAGRGVRGSAGPGTQEPGRGRWRRGGKGEGERGREPGAPGGAAVPEP